MNDAAPLTADTTAMMRSKAAEKKASLIMNDGLYPYLSPDIVGGSLPYVFGHEDEAVWNAAAQACSTDRINYTYTIADDRIWYLAVPSVSLASNPDSWCPLASALPGNSEYWDRETVYIYEQEGTAAGLRWDQETGKMQVYVGPARTVLPRLQTLDANFVTINPERATPARWKNRALQEEKLSRDTIYWLFWSGAAVAILAIIVWLGSHVIGMAISPNLELAQKETSAATEKLMMQATQVIRNDSDRHLFRMQELLLSLQNVGGTLMKYEVIAGKITWEALVPPAVSGDSLKQFQARAIGTSPDGRVRIQGTN
jgi:hypothetical protein